jgi:1,4-alpha-glucan branching enzyme
MIRKSYRKTGKSCLVTFTIPKDVEAEVVHLCGDFNEWSRSEHPLMRRKDGRFSRSVSLEAGRKYRFRYLLDENHWVNDRAADDYVANPYGSQDSVLEV